MLRSRIDIPSNVIGEVLDGEAVLLNLRTGVYFSLNKSGTVAWAILKETGDPEAVVQGLIKKFGIAEEQAGRDVSSLLDKLLAKGLIMGSKADKQAP